MELTRSFSADQFARALGSWDWVDIQGKQPLFTSPFGDVFFQAQDGFWFLDLLEGTLTRPWPDADALRAELDTAVGQDRAYTHLASLATSGSAWCWGPRTTCPRGASSPGSPRTPGGPRRTPRWSTRCSP